jgi:ADP-ribose pyrophosphatase YjhB (NUDIX family)
VSREAVLTGQADRVTILGEPARDLDEWPVEANGGQWLLAWHPPGGAPDGTPHGATAFCVTAGGDVVLVSDDGSRWSWPGGRPEVGESWEQVLHREMLEEACCTVRSARLLGFARARCLSGPEEGRVLVRSIWRADVEVLPWAPQHEIPYRTIVPAAELPHRLDMEPGFEPLYARAAAEAGLVRWSG